MTEIRSQGTFGLSHYRYSRTSRSKFEPLYLNLFTVQIELPPAIGSGEENTNLVLEGIQKISGLQSHSFPTSPVAQHFKWAARRFSGAKPETTTMDISLDFEVNLDNAQSAYVLKTLRKWCDLQYDPLTGRQGLKVEYTAPWMLITMTDRANRPYWQWKCYDVFPMSQLPAPELDYQSDEVYRITGFTLACDWWDETII